jgi:ubiquitin related modifier 1
MSESPDSISSVLTAFHSGGLEILFSNERKHKITVPGRLDDGSQPNISYLLRYLVDNLMKDQRKELFIMEDNVYVTFNPFLFYVHPI